MRRCRSKLWPRRVSILAPRSPNGPMRSPRDNFERHVDWHVAASTPPSRRSPRARPSATGQRRAASGERPVRGQKNAPRQERSTNRAGAPERASGSRGTAELRQGALRSCSRVAPTRETVHQAGRPASALRETNTNSPPPATTRTAELDPLAPPRALRATTTLAVLVPLAPTRRLTRRDARVHRAHAR